MATIKILKISKILPSSNNSSIKNNSNVPLSIHDSCWVPVPPIQRLFLYPPSNLQFQAIVESLKSSLASTLDFFHLLAGKLSYDPSSQLVFIDCSVEAVGEGVLFVEAESETLDFDRLAREEVYDHDAFSRLVPTISFVELPIPVFAAQVTRFSNGGVAVGFTLHHTVMDGKGMWQFLHAWTRNCKGNYSPITPFSVPIHDRLVIQFEGEKEATRQLLKDITPNLPKVMADQQAEDLWGNGKGLSRRTFTINKASIQTLKQIPLFQDPTRVSPPSTFVSLVAHTWISLTQARADMLGPKYPTSHLVILIDVRSHLNPPVDQSYAGNCIGVGFVHMSCANLLGPTGFVHTCNSIEQTIMARRRDPLLGYTEWEKEFVSLPQDTRINVSSSPKFRVYDTDFGWGKPSRTELVSIHGDGEVAIVAGREEGTVQVTVSISARFMDAFAKYFLSGVEN